MTSTDPAPSSQFLQRAFPCSSCGARLEFDPGAGALICPYCGRENPIPAPDAPVVELDFLRALEEARAAANTLEVAGILCRSCGADFVLSADEAAGACPYCGDRVVAEGGSQHRIKPGALLPFKVTRSEAASVFRRWLAARWFAPSDLKRTAQGEGVLTGTYVPYWTFDARTHSEYVGQRGDDDLTTEEQTVFENGRAVRRTRQVRHTRWSHASGSVALGFDDILVLASRSLPTEQALALGPWDLKALVPFDEAYLSGFRAENYRVDLEAGFEEAKEVMAGRIHAAIAADIGGDHQRILQVRTRYDSIRFKHLLLPVWLSAYRYHQRIYRFLVNARTAEVQGERPFSAAKIALAVAAALLAATMLALIAKGL